MKLENQLEVTEVTIEIAAGAQEPVKGSPLAAGYDLSSFERIVIEPGCTELVRTGVKISMPDGMMAEIRPRSGLAIKHSLTILNSPGTIDPDYRGEIKVILHNLGRDIFIVERGMRIAQMVLVPFLSPLITKGRVLSDTERGEGGFGHTGV